MMSELLARGYNVARPEVDVGDDIISVSDLDGQVTLVQVKAANPKPTSSGVLLCRFAVREEQVRAERALEFYFACLVRDKGGWTHFIILPQDALREAYASGCLGKPNRKGNLTFKVTIDGDKVSCHGQDWSGHLGNWDVRWPRIL